MKKSGTMVAKLHSKERTFLVAEISANHRQDLNVARALVRKAKACGVDAVKFQTYTPDTLTIDVKKPCFMVKHSRWGGQTLYQLYKKAYTPWTWFKTLKRVADDLGLIFFSTAFDKSSIDLLEDLDVPVHKIASFELVDLPLIAYAAKTKKPLILSTGMAGLDEIAEAIGTARSAGAKDITLLKCVSAYPAKPGSMNLVTIPDMAKRFKCRVGLSDHTLSSDVSVAAVSVGARMIEKHLTLSRMIKTPDSFFSVEPAELKRLVRSVRVVEEALGRIQYGVTAEERKSKIFRRSLFVVEDIRKGEVLTESNVRSIRPACGIEPKYLERMLGKRAKKSICKGTPLRWSAV